MKKGLIITAVLAMIICIVMIPETQVSADYDFEVCYHCNGTGRFHCNSCNDRGEVFCNLCAGKGGWACTYCDGVGYDICPSCHGDTYIRNGEGEIPPDAEPGTCGHCGGTGKLECIKCHGAGWGGCPACEDKGYEECMNGECVSHRASNGVCNYCKGTGFTSNDPRFKPEWNDGIHNIPKDGETIWYNGGESTYRYHKTPTAEDKKRTADELEAYRKKALENLEKVYTTYSEDLYSAKQLKKLKRTYEKAVKQVNKAEIYDDVSKAYYKYKGLILDIRPSVLEKYKEKCKKKLRKTNAELEKNHCVEDGYWDRRFEQVMNDGIEDIINAKTKSKVKKIMNKTLAKLVW